VARVAGPSPAPLLLAGSWGTEREPPERAGSQPGWHLPQHVREPALARRHLAEQVAAGADAITAPTYRSSRRALARFGEARRAREWTALAVALARQAKEEAGRDVLVCGSLPPLERFPAEEADADAFEAHAGNMADAGVDVLVVEPMGSVAAARAAALAAAATGLPVWCGVSPASGEWLGEWVEEVEPAEPQRLLLYGHDPASLVAALEELGRQTERPLGACLEAPPGSAEIQELLERGGRMIGLARGATAEALEPLRAAIDSWLEAQAAARGATRRTFEEWLDRAAAWAPGGAALWLGGEPELELPSGFGWTIVLPDELRRLPEGRYRLVVVDPAPTQEVDGPRLHKVLESGGILLAPLGVGQKVQAGLRVLDQITDPGLAILRRQ